MCIRLRYHFVFSLIAILATGCGDDGQSDVDAAQSGSDAAVDATAMIDASMPGTDAGTPDALAVPDASPGIFTLTSTAIMEGGTFPIDNTCQGTNVSPPLAWANPPAGTLGFAVVFTDLDNGLIHSVIWDIPGTRSDLPADVDKVYEPPDVPGAKQTRAYSPGVRGYLGPCPPNKHTYQFEIYAVGVASLPGVDFDSTRQNLVTALSGQVLGTALLTASHDPNP